MFVQYNIVKSDLLFFRVCRLTGAYYCFTCFGTDPSNEFWVIPARVIFNWDFRRFSVSRQAAEFLSQIQLYPLFDISSINPKIYSVVEEMERLKVIILNAVSTLNI